MFHRNPVCLIQHLPPAVTAGGLGGQHPKAGGREIRITIRCLRGKQTVSIAVYRTFSVDPLPVDLADLPKPADVAPTSDETAKRDETLPFWDQLRAETKASLQSKSRTARFIQAAMDHIFAVSSGYGLLRCMLVGGEYPACTEPNIADSLFKLSCVLTLLLIIPVTRDLPLIRIGRHLIGHSNPA